VHDDLGVGREDLETLDVEGEGLAGGRHLDVGDAQPLSCRRARAAEAKEELSTCSGARAARAGGVSAAAAVEAAVTASRRLARVIRLTAIECQSAVTKRHHTLRRAGKPSGGSAYSKSPSLFLAMRCSDLRKPGPVRCFTAAADRATCALRRARLPRSSR
jgi:hypothetical protein